MGNVKGGGVVRRAAQTAAGTSHFRSRMLELKIPSRVVVAGKRARGAADERCELRRRCPLRDLLLNLPDLKL